MKSERASFLVAAIAGLLLMSPVAFSANRKISTDACSAIPFSVGFPDKDSVFVSSVLSSVKSLKNAGQLDSVHVRAGVAVSVLTNSVLLHVDSNRYPRAFSSLKTDLGRFSSIILDNIQGVVSGDNDKAFALMDRQISDTQKNFSPEKLSDIPHCDFTIYDAAPWAGPKSQRCQSAFDKLEQGLGILLTAEKGVEDPLWGYLAQDDRESLGPSIANNISDVVSSMGDLTSDDLNCLQEYAIHPDSVAQNTTTNPAVNTALKVKATIAPSVRLPASDNRSSSAIAH